MIIRFPTALYTSIIPQNPQDGGNITYTISNEDPPRSFLVFSELPPSIELRQRPPRTLDPVTRREALDDRAFTSLTASPTSAGSNKKIVEIGQVLEFTDAPVADLVPMLVTDKNEFQHNTNLLDLSGLGISEDDINTINSSATELMKTLDDELNSLIIQRRNIEVALSENKKSQNENTKAIDALQVLIANGQSSLQPVFDELTEQGTTLAAEEADLIVQANQVSADATTKMNTIRELTQVVR